MRHLQGPGNHFRFLKEQRMKTAQRIVHVLIIVAVICQCGLNSQARADLAPPPEDGWESPDSHPIEPGTDSAANDAAELPEQPATPENNNSLNLIIAGIAIGAALVAGIVVRQRKTAGGPTEAAST